MECQFSVEKVKGQGHRMSKTTENWSHVYLRAADQAQVGQAPTANYINAIVRPNLLPTPETLGNWTDGRTSCRQSAVTCILEV